MITKEQLEQWTVGKGYVKDKWGHFQKVHEGKAYRLKVSNIAVRQEVKVGYDGGGSDWVRIRSGYFKDLSITPDGRLAGLRFAKF